MVEVSIESLLEIAKAIEKAGIKDDAAIAAILDMKGLASGSEAVSSIRKLIEVLPETGVVTKTVSEAGGVARGALEAMGDVTKGVLSYITATPTRTAITVGAVAAITAYGGYQLWQQKTAVANINPYSGTLAYTPGGTVSPAPITTPSGGTTQQKDYGVLGTLLQWFGVGLLGQAPEDAAKAMSAAVPWVEGAAVVIGLVGVGYFVNSLRSKKESIRIIAPSVGRRAYR